MNKLMPVLKKWMNDDKFFLGTPLRTQHNSQIYTGI
jgi:hypothetical protein